MINHILLAFVATFIITVVLGKIGIPMLRSLHAQQSIREEGPESHQAKAGTPTMGGAFMMVALVIGVALFAPWNVGTGMLLFLTLGHSLLGFFDDFVKAVKKRNLGLTAKQKLLGQFVLAAIFCYCITEIMVVPTTLWIPVVDIQLQLGWGYYVLAFLIIVGATNAVNLTDGLDGLASGTSAVAAIAFSVIGLMAASMTNSIGAESVAYFGAIVAAVCLGFLVYNVNPAKVFMGDTGSLALGGAFAAMAILTKTELLLVVIGGIFVMEALSVIIQVISFKTRGVRVFKMSPIHHHFELSGWAEQTVVNRFWFGGAVLAIIGVVLATITL
ncbi:phospho-N-acetylmuramoyl-pentapeptide-transferase [uncultured Veillonella sp.]|uniref:phospho-N-acetylmuramoyl-pentapeptide- transferase n=1 Tax=uncultured Veillonella sp. TaxID=159268 RepID=UPI00261F76F0|nr:phospho-N-acetylmuramoyl-pentapeptide-transferase [uncultured Veillonella sp.]